MTMAEGELSIAKLHFVRDQQLPALPPPRRMTGATGWIRENLLPTSFNIALTVLIVALLLWAVPHLVRFLIIDAAWVGADRGACLESVQHRPIGACWPFVFEWMSYFVYGSYPIPQRWRVDIFFLLISPR